jgi:hypothetical protein
MLLSFFSATILIKGIVYGRGVGSSKKLAKTEAAKKTLDILIPDLIRQLEEHKEQKQSDLSVSIFEKVIHFYFILCNSISDLFLVF